LASRLKQKRHKARVGSTADESGYTNNNRIQEGALTLLTSEARQKSEM
jgi:hypothetical protein